MASIINDTLILSRRQRVADQWNLDTEVVLVSSGSLVPIAGSDLHYEFRPHPDFAYLAGHGIADSVLAYDAKDRQWQLFGPRSTADEMVWHQPANEIGLPTSELKDWLQRREHQPVIESGDDVKIQAGIAEVRLRKDEYELSALRSAAATSQAGFSWVYENVTAGMTEREIQIGIEAEFFRAGAVRTAYPSIVASGPNGAYLHYVYGQDDSLSPATRTLEKGELLLIDAGGEFGGYASDVTRTVVVGAEPTDVQTFLWQVVLRAQELAIDRCRPGQEWREVHLDSARVIGSGLVELELLRGDVDSLIASGAVALFYPHGLGHLIGLTVHDAGGYPPGREPGSHPQSRYLRMDRPLEAGMITSVEPGVYFIDALLTDPAIREQFADEVVWESVDPLRSFGGIRIEDDVHVTDHEPEVLSGAIEKPLRIG
ncbi:MAG TPA: aminopeptidase P family protein [Acidimicrobiales bacterium]|jgi:Xaa-Pro aminopeptidase|nr:aminopeptidase P family protein [Acidimicrobiales bacterium]|tara:strand:+ start:2299 stop:3582 length:1284 start_codon:yes stop_codon:yes gene_type:complete